MITYGLKIMNRSLSDFLFHLENKIDHKVQLSQAILEEFLTHPSYSHEHHCSSYERLEFLGDTVVNTLFSHWLFRHFPLESEGQLSKMRAELVSTKSLFILGEFLELATFLRWGKGENLRFMNHGTDLVKDKLNKISAKVFEAFLGAIFIELGFSRVSEVFESTILAWEKTHHKTFFSKEDLINADVKTKAQELIHKKYKSNPRYVQNRSFYREGQEFVEVSLCVGDELLATIEAQTKREAEKILAKHYIINS